MAKPSKQAHGDGTSHMCQAGAKAAGLASATRRQWWPMGMVQIWHEPIYGQEGNQGPLEVQ